MENYFPAKWSVQALICLTSGSGPTHVAPWRQLWYQCIAPLLEGLPLVLSPHATQSLPEVGILTPLYSQDRLKRKVTLSTTELLVGRAET